jgi:hypothetical protein
MWKEAPVISFDSLSRYLSGWKEKNNEKYEWNKSVYQSRMTRDTLNKINARYQLSQLAQSDRKGQLNMEKRKKQRKLNIQKYINNQKNAF